MSKVKKSFREDWTSLPFILITGMGFVAAVLDFVFLQNLQFQVFGLVGLALVVVGGYLRMKARVQLRKKAGFDNLVSTSRLQIVEGHTLVKDGLYQRIRHPLYLGEILRNFGIVLIFSSGYGMLFIVIGAILLLFRIHAEEEMLIEAFGSEYEDYKRKTKRLIPYVY
ncbi:MAG: isoprenylcysteine carboxylmethyltransferase family protein [Candidatus Bathyarchaeota archaeon]|nr:isoprenylcysteine carboxylmethyltransferase family protein [Candidatus Bathyarchaeota archaeon]